MKLSIVVPVYNVERYVRRCVLSIINQDDDLFKDIELIIVNDGTKDESVEKVQDLVDKYDNIILVNQDNQGLSMARNNGFTLAKGDYVWFVDSDDWISKDALKKIMPYLDGVNDIISFGIIESSEKGETPNYTYFTDVKTMSGIDSFRQGCVHGTAAWKAVYRKDFMNKKSLRFMPGVYNEDDEFCLRASYLAETVTILPWTLYYYYLTIISSDNHASITNTVNPKLGFDFLTVASSLVNFTREFVKEKDVSNIFDHHISMLINNGLGAISRCSKKDQHTFCMMFKEYKGLNKCLYCGGGKYFIEAVLFTIFPSHIVRIYNLMKSFKR